MTSTLPRLIAACVILHIPLANGETSEIYVCRSPSKGPVGSPTVVKPGQTCPNDLRPGGELAIEFNLPVHRPLQLRIDFSRTRDVFNLPRDFEIMVDDGAKPSQVRTRQVLPFDAAPYGENGKGFIYTHLPNEWLHRGRNRITLSMRHVDFPGVELELGAVCLTSGPSPEAALRTFQRARKRQSDTMLIARRTEISLRRVLSSSPYLIGVENSLHKLFQDEPGLLFQECREAAGGRPWSLRRSRRVGHFYRSLLRQEVTPDADKKTGARPELVMEACRNERESAQVVIVPGTADLTAVNVSCDGLNGPGDFIIPARNIDLRVAGYVKTKPPRYDHEYLGWWPDVLLPNFPFSVFVGQVQPVWITVHVPGDAPSGLYSGTVRVAPGNERPREVPITFRVWDFSLPREPFLQTAAELSTSWIRRFYASHPEANRGNLPWEEIYLNFVKALLEHRLSPFTLGQDTGLIVRKSAHAAGQTWDFSRFDRAMETAMAHGLTRFAAGTVFNNDLASTQRQQELIDLYAHLVQKGWFDRAYYYGIDEGSGNIPTNYGIAKKLLPGVRTLTTVTHKDDRLENVVDIYVPRTVDDWDAYYRRGVPARLRGLGKEYWVYTSGYPAPPVWPQVYVDCPAVEQRIIPWTCARWGITGYLKVPLTSWYHMAGVRMDYENVRTPWDVNPGIYGDSNGEILMLYCGPEGQMLPSMRLAVLRDGIEDYDYHSILSRHVAKLRAAGLPETHKVLAKAVKALDLSGLIIKPYLYPRRPYIEGLFNRRRMIAQAIVAAKEALHTVEDPEPAPPPSRRRGPLWLSAVQATVNNVRPTAVTITLVNQSDGPLAGAIRATGPEGWQIQPSSWKLRLAKRELRRLRTLVRLAEDAELPPDRPVIKLTARTAGETHAYSVPVTAQCCRGYLTIGPFKPKLLGTAVRPLPPETKIDLEGEYPGASGKNVEWRELLQSVTESRIDFDRLYGTPPTKYVPQNPKENYANVAFALSFVHSRKEKDLTLQLDGPNRMKTWLNGKPVFGGAEDEFAELDEGEAGDDLLGVGDSGAGPAGTEVVGLSRKEVRLVSGWNTLLVRVEKSVGKVPGDWFIALSLLDGEEPAQGLLWRLRPKL